MTKAKPIVGSTGDGVRAPTSVTRLLGHLGEVVGHLGGHGLVGQRRPLGRPEHDLGPGALVGERVGEQVAAGLGLGAGHREVVDHLAAERPTEDADADQRDQPQAQDEPATADGGAAEPVQQVGHVSPGAIVGALTLIGRDPVDPGRSDGHRSRQGAVSLTCSMRMTNVRGSLPSMTGGDPCSP
ncbi:MAG: hypothetical protein R2702_11845 [Acidimicrobiales bacterium]